MTELLANGNELLNLLEELAELEWGKCELRNPSIVTKDGTTVDDRSSQPPFTSFRLKVESQSLLQKLSDAVNSYAGEIDWVLVQEKRTSLAGANWTICPKRMLDAEAESFAKRIPVWRYFKEYLPDFGPIAYRDMLPLVEHLKSRLR